MIARRAILGAFGLALLPAPAIVRPGLLMRISDPHRDLRRMRMRQLQDMWIDEAMRQYEGQAAGIFPTWVRLNAIDAELARRGFYARGITPEAAQMLRAVLA